MTKQSTQRLAQLSNQLTNILMTAAICADEIRAMILVDTNHFLAREELPTSCRNGAPANQRPLLDQSTFSVRWYDKSLHLGNTRMFWVLDHLALHANQYVTHLELIQDVWDDEELTTATIRSVVRHLRDKLRHGNMEGLADAIHGHNGHYILVLRESALFAR